MFLFPCSQASKNCTQLAGQNGTRLVARFDWDQRFVTEPPSYQRVYGQLVDFGHCSPSFWPQGPALNRFLCNFVPRPKDCNRESCQGRLAPVVKPDPLELGQLNKYINMEKDPKKRDKVKQDRQ